MTLNDKIQYSVFAYLIIAVMAAMITSALEQKGYSHKRHHIIAIVIYHAIIAVVLYLIWR